MSNFYKLKFKKKKKDKEGARVPDDSNVEPGTKSRCIHYFMDGTALFETDKEVKNKDKVGADDPVRKSHDDWYVTHPQDIPEWVEDDE